jgi:glycosidase
MTEEKHRMQRRFSPHPLLYEVNARVLLNELSSSEGKRVTLASLPDRVIDDWASYGFDAVWLMGVWTTGALGRQIARTIPHLRELYKNVLPDFTDKDVLGSPYAVKSYTIPREYGGKQGLLSLRKKLEKRGMGLVLDFVGNHTARDCAWVSQHPEYYVHGRDGEDVTNPDYFFRTRTGKGDTVLAYGRDPYFSGWTDTVQLNYWHPAVRREQQKILSRIATLCDGVRCDMAMLLLREVFGRTWGDHLGLGGVRPEEGEFWKEAMEHVKAKWPHFVFIAEAYWNLEWQLQQLGFDYTYDKVLYDRLLREGAVSVYDHLKAESAFQQHSMRFIENHDEPRAAHALPSEAWHFAAAMVASTTPGMMLFHDGQLAGRRIKLPLQLRRRPAEPEQPSIKSFYKRLLSCLKVPAISSGDWHLLTIRPAWNDNHTWTNVIAHCWCGKAGDGRLIVVNYAPQNSQCYVDLHPAVLSSPRVEFRDLMGDAVYVRERSVLSAKGMFYDLPGYGFHLFEVLPAQKSSY